MRFMMRPIVRYRFHYIKRKKNARLPQGTILGLFKLHYVPLTSLHLHWFLSLRLTVQKLIQQFLLNFLIFQESRIF